MTPATNEQIKEQYMMSGIAWKWFKKYFNMEDTDDNWHAAIKEMSELRVGQDNKLLSELLMSYLNELERHIKGDRNENYSMQEVSDICKESKCDNCVFSDKYGECHAPVDKERVK